MLKLAVIDANQKANKAYKGIVASVVGQWLEWEIQQAGLQYVDPKEADIVFVSHASALDFTLNVPRELRYFGIEVDPKKRNRRPYLIAGGPVDATPFVALGICDALAIGEAYRIVRNLLQAIKDNSSLNDIRDMFIADPHAIERCQVENLKRDPKRPWLLKDEIEPLASPDSFIDWKVPPVKTDDNVIRVIGSKGCHFKCSFCATTYRQKYAKNPNDRAVRAQVRHMHKRGERVQIVSNDPANLPYYAALSDALDSGSYTIEEFLKPENRAAIIRQRPKIVRFGVEGISERIRYAWNKPIPNPTLLDVFADLRKNKINSHAFIIVNAPFEADYDWQAWANFVAKLSRQHDWGILRLKFTTFQPSPPAPLSRFVPPFIVKKRWDSFFENYIRNDVSKHLALISPRRSEGFIRTVAEGLQVTDETAEFLLSHEETFDLAPTPEDFSRLLSNVVAWPIAARTRWKVAEKYKQRMHSSKPLPKSATVQRIIYGARRMRDKLANR